MKINILTLMGILLMFCSCMDSKEQAVDKKSHSEECMISLKTPTGEMIARNLQILKEDFSAFQGDLEPKDFKITEINYVNIKQGYVAILGYETLDGIKGQFAVTNSPLVYTENRLKIVSCNMKNEQMFFMCESEDQKLNIQVEDDGSCVFSCMISEKDMDNAETDVLVMGRKKY